MARADLHYALVLDSEIYQASKVDPSLLDPVVRIEGGLPGTARPFIVLRDYQGPQGFYTEHVTITDRKGREVARSQVRRIELSGEMFEDRFTSTFRNVRIDSGAEHELHCFIDGDEVGSVPVFLEFGDGGDPRVAAEETFKKALQKGAIVWLTVPQPDGREHDQAAWFVLEAGKVYVLSGPTEQQIPHLSEAEEVFVTARSKDLRSRVSRVPAAVRVVPADDPLFDRIARTGLGKRLNLPDGDGALDRWRDQCVLVELTPRFSDDEEDEVVPTAGAVATAASESNVEESTAPDRKPAEEDIHVEAQIDQEIYDQLIAEGKSERIARAKAKAAFVRREKARIRAERAAS